VEWAVTLKGRDGSHTPLLLFASREEAESIAAELRGRGQAVEVQPANQRDGRPA
jgi:hypothetical protein